MSVHIVCEHCSGELQVPHVSAGKKVRCPMCGNVFVSTALAVPEAAPVRVLESPTPWSPVNEEDLDNPIPWYILLGAIAPAGMLGFVAHEPIAFAVAAVFVMIALFVATRRDWSKWSRFMGVVSLSLFAYGAAAAVNLYAHGSFARLGSLLPFADRNNPDPSASELERAVWNEFAPLDGGVKLLIPGTVTPDRFGDPTGLEILIHEAKFPKEGVVFALRTFKIPTPVPSEKAVDANLIKMLKIAVSIFSERDPDEAKKIYYHDHPGFECSFFVTSPKNAEIICQMFLVRDRVYLVSVTAEKLEPIKPLADRFLASLRLTEPVEAMRATTRGNEPDWKALGRPPIPKAKPLASYSGHLRPPIIVLAFSVDGKQMVTGSSLEHVVLWHLESGHGARIGNTEAYPFFAIHPSGKEMVMAFQIGDAPPRIRFLPLDISVPELAAANTDTIGFSADQKSAFVAIDRDITAWEANDKRLWYRNAADSQLTRIALSRDGRLLASSAAKETKIKLWNVENKDKGDHIATSPPGHGALDKAFAPIQQLAFAPSGKLLASAGFDTTVKIWDLANVNRPTLMADLLHIGEQSGVPVATVEFSNDGKLLATGDFTGVVRLWETNQWKLLHEFRASESNESVQVLRFTPDNSKLAAAVEMGTGRAGVNLFDVKSLPAIDAASPSIGLQLTDEPPLVNDLKESKDPKGKK